MKNSKSLWILSVLVVTTLVATPALAQLTLPKGEDGFKTPVNGTQVDVSDIDASAIFGPGASFANSTIALRGQPINSSQLGNIDTVLRREDDAVFAASLPASSGRINITLLAISLRSKQAVQVDMPTGAEFYNLRVCANENNGGTGSMSLTQTNSNGGNFDAAFTVNPVLRFTPTDGGATIVVDCAAQGIDCGDWDISTSNADWVHNGGGFDPSSKGVAIVQRGLYIDADCDGDTDVGPTFGTGNFFPGFEANPPTFPAVAMNHDHSVYSTYHKVKPPVPPGNPCPVKDAEPVGVFNTAEGRSTGERQVQPTQAEAFCAQSTSIDG